MIIRFGYYFINPHFIFVGASSDLWSTN